MNAMFPEKTSGRSQDVLAVLCRLFFRHPHRTLLVFSIVPDSFSDGRRESSKHDDRHQ
jgi:hypothetical protein